MEEYGDSDLDVQNFNIRTESIKSLTGDLTVPRTFWNSAQSKIGVKVKPHRFIIDFPGEKCYANKQ